MLMAIKRLMVLSMKKRSLSISSDPQWITWRKRLEMSFIILMILLFLWLNLELALVHIPQAFKQILSLSSVFWRLQLETVVLLQFPQLGLVQVIVLTLDSHYVLMLVLQPILLESVQIRDQESLHILLYRRVELLLVYHHSNLSLMVNHCLRRLSILPILLLLTR